MKATELGRVYGLTFTDRPRLDFACRAHSGQAAQRLLKTSGISIQLRGTAASAAGFSALKGIAGNPVRFNFKRIAGNPVRFNFKDSPAFEGISRALKGLEPMMLNYNQAQQRAGRRYGPVISALEIPGEVGIGDLTAAFTALAAGNHAQLTRLRRRLRTQARRGDQQAAALEEYLALLLELLHDEELRRVLLEIRASVRVLELAILADLRTSARASARRRRPPRCEQDPVRSRRCSRAPNDASSQSYPEVAA